MEDRKVEIKIEFDSCKKCPFFDMEKVYTADSFDNLWNWLCLKRGGMIIFCVDTFDKDPKIPDWCPLLKEEENKDGN